MSKIEYTTVFDVPAKTLWRALTESDLLAIWLMPNDFRPEVGHEFTLITDPAPMFDGTVHCKVLEIDEPRRMRWSWRGGPIDTLVTFTVTELGPRQCAYEFAQEGFHGPKAAFAKFFLSQGTKKIPPKMRILLETLEVADPKELLTRRDCIEIAASPEDVWHALTDTAESASWYFGTGIESSFEKGATYRYAFPNGTTAIEGIIRRAEAPQVLDLTFHAVWNDGVAGDEPTRVIWTIEAIDGGSRVCVTHQDLAPGSATEEEVSTGWPTLLGNLKTHIEGSES